MTNEEFLRRFDAGEKFTEEEIQDMCWGEVSKQIKEDILDRGQRVLLSSRRSGELPDVPVEVRRVEKVAYDYVPIEEGE